MASNLYKDVQNPQNDKLYFREEVLKDYGERMHKLSKSDFREFVVDVAQVLGFDVKIEKNPIAKNVVIGNPDKARVVVGAHYDTPPRMPNFFIKHQFATMVVGLPVVLLGVGVGLPQVLLGTLPPDQIQKAITGIEVAYYGACAGIVSYMFGFLGNANKNNYDDNSSGVLGVLNLMLQYKNLPQEEKDKVCFVLFDNEEKFLLGSYSYAFKHRDALKKQDVINLDCIGDGGQMNLFYFGKNRPQIAEKVRDEMTENGTFVPRIRKSTIFSSCSDHLAFKKANGAVCLLSTRVKDKKSIYNHVHSKFDKRLDGSNIVDVVKTLTGVIDKVGKIERNETKLLTESAVEKIIYTRKGWNFNTTAPKTKKPNLKTCNVDNCYTLDDNEYIM